MSRRTNAAIMAGGDLDAGTSVAVAACEAAYPGYTAMRAYADTTGNFVVTMGFTAVDGVQSPLNVVVSSAGVLLYSERRFDTEPYSEIVSRVEEARIPDYRRPRTGALTLTGIAGTRTVA